MKSGDLKRLVESTRSTLVCLLLAAATLAVYGRVAGFEFTNYDDPTITLENPIVLSGLTLRGVLWALTTCYYEYWHPLMWLSHMLDCQLFGLWAGGHHLVSVGFHVANTLLLYVVLERMTGAWKRSALVAALFALHPLHVESVAWIAERKDVLSGFFFMLTLWAYVRYVEKAESTVQNSEDSNTQHPADTTPFSAVSGPTSEVQGSKFKVQRSMVHVRAWSAKVWYNLALLCFALGLMSKPILMTLPFVLLLLDYWPLKRSAAWGWRSTDLGKTVGRLAGVRGWAGLVAEKARFFLLTAASCVLMYIWARNNGNLLAAGTEPWGLRLANVPVSYARYLGKMIWPTGLVLPYPMPGHWAWWQTGGAALVLIVITLFVVRRARSAPYLIVGWLIFLGVLVPTIRVVHTGTQSIADRYTYIPSIGIFLAVVWLLSDLARPLPGAKRQPGNFHFSILHSPFSIPRPRPVHLSLTVLALFALSACAVLARCQVRYWRNSVTLFEHTVEVTPDNPVAQCNLGHGLFMEGKPALAAEHYRAALAIDPGYSQAHFNLAGVLRDQERWREAAEHYLAVARLRPDVFLAHLALAQILPRLGRTKEAAGQMEEFLRTCPRADLESPNSLVFEPALTSLNDLAWLLATSQRAEDRDARCAVGFAERACELTQYKRTIMVGTLAAAYAEAGRFPEAVTTAQMACTLATQAGDQVLSAMNQRLIELYRASKPYHESAAP